MNEDQLKQHLERVANVIRTALLIERNISLMSRLALAEVVDDIDAISIKWAYEDDASQHQDEEPR